MVQALWRDLGTSKEVLSSNQCWPIIETFSSLSGRLFFWKFFLDPVKGFQCQYPNNEAGYQFIQLLFSNYDQLCIRLGYQITS